MYSEYAMAGMRWPRGAGSLFSLYASSGHQ